MRIAKGTRRIALENTMITLIIKAFFLTLAILSIATMWEAVIADVGVALITILNAIRILR